MRTVQWAWLVGVSVVSLIAGCGSANVESSRPASEPGGGGFDAPRAKMPDRLQDQTISMKTEAAVQPRGGKPAEDPAPADAGIERKIIYSAAIEVIVKDLDETRREVERITEEFKGYIAKSEVSGDIGKRRSGYWTLKIPAIKFRLATAALSKLGITAKNSSDSQDVTEEFIDVQARVKNLKNEEEILNKLLKDVVRLEDVLKLREQIKLIRGDIERAEGRLKYLSTMAALSTITLTAREEDEQYVPPTAPVPKTFMQSVESTFGTSWKLLQQTAEGVALFVVALAPWLPIILIAVLLLRYLLRWLASTIGNLFATEPSKPRPAKAIPLPEPTEETDNS